MLRYSLVKEKKKKARKGIFPEAGCMVHSAKGLGVNLFPSRFVLSTTQGRGDSHIPYPHPHALNTQPKK